MEASRFGSTCRGHAIASRVSPSTPHHRAERVSIDTWAEDHGDSVTDELVEEAVHHERYGETLSLLWVP